MLFYYPCNQQEFFEQKPSGINIPVPIALSSFVRIVCSVLAGIT